MESYQNSSVLPTDRSPRGGAVTVSHRKTLLLFGAMAPILVVAGLYYHSRSRLVADANNTNDSIIVELEGKKKKHHEDDIMEVCTDGKYSKRTLQLAYELPFAALFRDPKKYEASSVILDGETAYAVCDSSWDLSRFDIHLVPFDPTNVQVASDVERAETDDSGYEAIFLDNNTFYVVRESVQHEDATYHAIIEELAVTGNSYHVDQKCPAAFEFEGDSKGFEGAVGLHNLQNELVILGLCEGNHCSETRKKDRGNGRLVAMKKNDETCEWETLSIIHLPTSVDFTDYSAISVSENGKVAITSQEDSQLWVGTLHGRNNDGLWDIDNLAFDEKYDVYQFPKGSQCETIYCNIEGIHWINDDVVVAVSDKMKGRGKQDFRCFDKDQSVHVFALPQ